MHTAESERLAKLDARLDHTTQTQRWQQHAAKCIRLKDRAGVLKSLFQMAYADREYHRRTGDAAMAKSAMDDMQAVEKVGEKMGIRVHGGFRDQEFSDKRRELLATVNSLHADIEAIIAQQDEELSEAIQRVQAQVAQFAACVGLVLDGSSYRDPHNV